MYDKQLRGFVGSRKSSQENEPQPCALKQGDTLRQQERRQDPPIQHRHRQANFHHQPQPQMAVPPVHEVQQQQKPIGR
jgi:hypothetical protein